MQKVTFTQSELEQMIYIDAQGAVCCLNLPNSSYEYEFENMGSYIAVNLVSKTDREVHDSYVCWSSLPLQR